MATLLLTACGSSPLPAPSDGSEAPGTFPTATIAPTAGPTASPTPEPLPQDLVSQGERDLRNGNWQAAQTEFEAVLRNSSATVDEIVSARIGLAQAAQRQGDFVGAREAPVSYTHL
ncbi:MAG: outer membrane protein assembly factor BamD, partial [Chloroflexi bacterium]|nr:outer membrane protein assembly factor BamD [Chloroflexota bacterium]